MNIQNNSSTNDVKICSYNLHGSYNGLPMLKSLCNSFDIILIQEHWLHTHELYKFSEIFPDYNSCGISSMNEKLAAGLLVGRPFGGVAILWKKSLNFSMKRLDYDKVADT
jgi:hypothetical protein